MVNEQQLSSSSLHLHGRERTPLKYIGGSPLTCDCLLLPFSFVIQVLFTSLIHLRYPMFAFTILYGISSRSVSIYQSFAKTRIWSGFFNDCRNFSPDSTITLLGMSEGIKLVISGMFMTSESYMKDSYRRS